MENVTRWSVLGVVNFRKPDPNLRRNECGEVAYTWGEVPFSAEVKDAGGRLSGSGEVGRLAVGVAMDALAGEDGSCVAIVSAALVQRPRCLHHFSIVVLANGKLDVVRSV